MTATEKQHITAVTRQQQLRGRTKDKFRITGGAVEIYEGKPAVQDIETVLAERNRSYEKLMANAKTGDEIAGRGIYLGKWTPKNAAGKRLSVTFNVFAAPQDLTDQANNKVVYTYNETRARIATLQNWNGFDGADYANSEALYAALEKDEYDGGWIIPPRELLIGTEADARIGQWRAITQLANLFDMQSKGSFRNAFTTTIAMGDVDYGHFYWSSTERSADPSCVLNVRFQDGFSDWYKKNESRSSCRPIRLEPKP